MLQKYLKFFIIIIAVAFIVPQVTFAAWWNPFSWGVWNRVFHFQRTEQKQEQKVDVTTWKTYKNAEFGVELKVPSTYKVTEDNSDKKQPYTQFLDENSVLLIDYWWNGTDRAFVSYKEITVGGKPAKEYYFGKSVNQLDSIHVTINDQETIWFYPKNKEFLTNQDVSTFNQILSTFKFSASADATQSWKTYTNTKYGFEIKYPSNLKETISGKGKMGAYSLLSLDLNKNGSDFNINKPSYIRLVVEDENFVLGTRDWKAFELGQIKGDIASTGAGYEIVFFPSPQGKGFFLSTQKNPLTDAETKKILSTFKFITPAVGAVSWKTYTSQKYGFSFKYPLGWSLEVDNTDSINLYKYIYNPNEKQYEGLVVIRVFNPNPAITMGDAGGGDRPDIISSSVTKIDGVLFERKVVTFGVGNLLSYRGVVKSNLGNETDINNFGIATYVYSYVKSSSGGGGDFDSILDEIMKTFKFIGDPVRDAFIKTNLAYLTNYTSNYFIGDDVHSWCFSEKYNNLKNIIIAKYKDADVHCYCENVNCLNTEKWCVSAKLFNGYYCVDSGAQKIVSDNAKVCSGGVCKK